jgi:hypothetical protein
MQRTGRSSSWDDAAANLNNNEKMYKALFYNFKDLRQAAEKYASSHAGGGYRRAMGQLSRTTDRVMHDETHMAVTSCTGGLVSVTADSLHICICVERR